MNSVYIGIDTSNYRTSVAAVDERGHAVFQKAVLLDVVQGERGLRQSDAFSGTAIGFRNIYGSFYLK